MIETTLENIRKYLEYKFKEADREDWKVYLDALDKDGDMKDGLYITLLRIEEETSIQTHRYLRPNLAEEKQLACPDLYVNLHIIITAHSENYNTSLTQISATMGLLNSICDFDFDVEKENEETDAKSRVYAAVRELSVELQTLTAEQNNSLWQTLGCKLVPAVCYKVRMVVIKDETDRMAAPVIEEVFNKFKTIQKEVKF